MWADEHAHVCMPGHKHVEPRDQCSDIFLNWLWCPVQYGLHRPHYLWIPPGCGGWELRASGLCSRGFTNSAISLDSFESIFSKSWKRKSYHLSNGDSQSNDDPGTSNFFLFSLSLFSFPPLFFKQNLQVSTFHIPIFPNVIHMEPETGIWESVFSVKWSWVARFR